MIAELLGAEPALAEDVGRGAVFQISRFHPRFESDRFIETKAQAFAVLDFDDGFFAIAG